MRKLILTLALGLISVDAVAQLKGTVKVDGSSTVFPITEAVAEEFGKEHRRVRVQVGVSGTGGGFKKFCADETHINDASRTIKSKEVQKCKASGVKYMELPVAYDGISVVINPKNDWVDHLTVAELKKIWEPGSKVKNWKDVRPGFPDRKLKLYGPGTDSGTFDYFTEAVVGKSHHSRSDFTKSEDDNVLVKGVAGDLGSLGYFGFAYYKENTKLLKAVPVKNGKAKPVMPTEATINNGSYAPLSRPVFIYVNTTQAKDPAVGAFIRYYLSNVSTLVSDVGYVSLPGKDYQANLKAFESKL